MAGSLFALSPSAAAEDFQQALVSAYNTNPRLMAERARVREIDENYVQAQAQGRINASISTSIGRTLVESETASLFGGTSSSDDWLSPQSGQLSIVKPLYQGGRVKGLKAQAKAGILSARQGLRNTEQNVLLSAATSYLDVLRDEETARIRRNNVRVLTRQKFASQDRFDVGEGTRTDIAQSDARLAAAEIGLAQADAQLAISRASYVRFVGNIPENLTKPPQFELPATLHEAQLRGRANNPQLVASRYNENAAQSAIHVAKSAGKPSLSLNGAVQGATDSSANVPRSESASITARLNIPLYAGGLNQSRVRAAKQAKIRSRFETRELERALDQTVANLWAQVIAAQRSLVASRKQVEAAEIAFEGVELEQQVGTRSTLDVLDAEQELLNAKLSVVEAERNFDVAGYQLLVTIGGFDSYSLQLPVERYDPETNYNIVTENAFINKYYPGAIRSAVSDIPETFDFVPGKVVKDVGELFDALVPGDASTDSEADGAGKLVGAASPVVKILNQVPDMPGSFIDTITIDDPFDPETKVADPEEIDPQPELIITRQKSDSP
jgi:outer membrane protein